MRAGTSVIFIDRESVTKHTTNKRGERVPYTYTREHVLRGVWDGERAVLYEMYDPKKLKTIVTNPEWLIPIHNIK